MELSGLIFVALALVWAVVLIPKALKHHDEVARTRSVDRVSDAMRVLARREPVNRRQARLVVRPSAAIPQQRSGPVDLVAPAVPAVRPLPARDRRAAAAAARRRRRILLALLVITAGIGAGAYLGHLQPWAPAVPGGVVLAFLVVARVTVRRENARRAARSSRVAPEAAAGSSSQVLDTGEAAELAEPVNPAALDDTSTFGRGALDAEPAAHAETLWDPLPVTLPTYVGKPRATRSVRTIDLTAPGVASSGRDAAASALVAEAATSGPDDPEQRMVGS